MKVHFQKMKRAVFLLTAFAVCGFSSVPAFAASEPKYVPLIPEFLSVSGDQATLHTPVDTKAASLQPFFSDFYKQPYLILLSQWTHNEYYPPNTSKQEYVGDDKMWFVYFVKPHDPQKKKYFFTYFDPAVYPDRRSQPMQVNIDGYSSMDIVSYKYDFKNKKFLPGTLQKSVSQLNFSYVIGSATLSHPVSFYPYYDYLAGNQFVVESYVHDGSPCHYNWWIGKKNIGITDDMGGGDSGGDSGDSGGGSGGGGDSGGGGGSGTPDDPRLDHVFEWLDPQDYKDLKDLLDHGNYLIVYDETGRYIYILDLGGNPKFDKDGNDWITYPYYIYKIDTKNPGNKYIIKEDNKGKPFKIKGNNIISSSGTHSRPSGSGHKKPPVIVETPSGDIHIGDQTGGSSQVIDKNNGGGSGGGSGGSSGGSETPGTDKVHPPDYLPEIPDPDDYDFKGWHLFDPDDYDNFKPRDEDPWGYDPLEGIEIPQRMPEIPYNPNIPNFEDPFHIGGVPNMEDPFHIGNLN